MEGHSCLLQSYTFEIENPSLRLSTGTKSRIYKPILYSGVPHIVLNAKAKSMNIRSVLRWSKKIVKWLFIVFFALVCLLLIAIEAFDRYVSSESGAHWLYSEIPGFTPSVHYTTSGIRYLKLGDPEKPPLLLIHGAPGSIMDWTAFAKNAEIFDHFQLLIPDRPGYGGTKPRGPEPSITIQAKRLLEVLENEEEEAVVLGHSYGGPIAIVMAAINPEKVRCVIGAAGQYDPDNEVTFNISYWINFKLFKYLLPRMLWVSNVEKLTHPDALRAILPLYSEVKKPVYLLHGDIDTLVPYGNSTFLMKYLGEEGQLITLDGIEHPFHMQEPKMLVDYVIRINDGIAE